MRGAQVVCMFVSCLLVGRGVAADPFPPEVARAMARSLFQVGDEAVPVAGLDGEAAAQVEAYNACRHRFASRLGDGGLPAGPKRALGDAGRRLEKTIVCSLGGAGIEEAAAYAGQAELAYEWEGMADGPLAEAAFARAYLAEHQATPLRPFLLLFIAHRSRCALEAMAREGDAEGALRARLDYRTHLEAALGERRALIRLAAAGLDALPFVYLEPRSKANAPGPAPSFVPAIPLERAIELARAFVLEQHLDVSGQFLASVSLRHDQQAPGAGLYWLVPWTWAQPRLGGEVAVRVAMDGSVQGGRLGP